MPTRSYLLQALTFAVLRQGFCAPNPAVGAVIVKNNQVIATGYHHAPGYAHAEVDALNKLGEEAQGATLYVTLEPCCVWGRTPPCTELLIARGIHKVVYGCKDPNPQVAGQGITTLQQAGIECVYQPLAEISKFYQAYIYWWQHALPWVTAKLALSLDGKIAAAEGQPVAITGTKAALFTHQQRAAADAILTSARTITCDDPQLNARLDATTIAKPLYILDTRLETPNNAQIWQTAKNLTFFHAVTVSATQIKAKQQQGARCIAIPSLDYGLDWQMLLTQIGKDGMHHLWVEAGGHTFESLLATSHCQRAYIYVAAKVLGEHALVGLRDPLILQGAQKISWNECGDDAICQVEFL